MIMMPRALLVLMVMWEKADEDRDNEGDDDRQ